jgi:hypothetical protein
MADDDLRAEVAALREQAAANAERWFDLAEQLRRFLEEGDQYFDSALAMGRAHARLRDRFAAAIERLDEEDDDGWWKRGGSPPWA